MSSLSPPILDSHSIMSSRDIQHLMVIIDLPDSAVENLRKVFKHVYYHPELWQFYNFFGRDEEKFQKAYEAIPKEEWENTEVVLLVTLLHVWEKDDLIRGGMPNLKWIHTRSVGTDFINGSRLFRNEPEGSDLIVTRNAGVPSSPIAQHAFMLILSVYRKLARDIMNQYQRKWIRTAQEDWSAPDIGKVTYGIFGYGSIGREIARLARAWGAKNILACNTSGQKSKDTAFPFEGRGDPEGLIPNKWFSSMSPESFKEFLEQTDILVVAAPATAGTIGILNARTLSYLKSTAIIINISRGSIIDQDALVDTLNNGRLAGAGLDSITPEPLRDENDPLWTAKNVIITPHLSYMAGSHWDDTIELLKVNRDRLRNGEKMYNVASLDGLRFPVRH
ncbi:hypothetical protein DL96DRAFT_277006 [Flagelloscypha sp. PMI_526]|nr:hypothetical protein DL96DRAFT_277006 [Flagelloscypha sp. PMI_526]